LSWALMNREDLRRLAREASGDLGPLADEEGAFLYSSAETLVLGDLYILGLNPGGVPGRDGATTIEQSLEDLPRRTKNEYLQPWDDGRGGTYPPGRHPLQRRLRWLVAELGYDLARVCASNLIFVRSQVQEGAEYRKRASRCWPVHERILKIVQPKMLIVYGNGEMSPFQWLRHDLDGPQAAATLPGVESGHGKWECLAIRRSLTGREVTVVGLPHLSR
jgi:hypothetical protein